MYVRIKTTPLSPKKMVQIVESIRRDGRIVQKIVRHVGLARDEKELTDLKLLAESIKARLEADPQGLLFTPEELARMAVRKQAQEKAGRDEDYRVNLKDLFEEERVVRGIHDIYGDLFDELQFASILANPSRQKVAASLFRDIVLARVANPLSKRGSVALLEEDFGRSLDLESVYEMMDKIDGAAVTRLNDLTYAHTKRLFPEKIDVIFFDCTTIYFEAFEEDELRRNGYSKDLMFNQPQVLIALMVTKEGLPVGYQAFPGDTYEGHTVIPFIEQLKERYQIGKVVFVGDAAMFSENNLKEFEGRGIEYIVGCRLHNIPKALQAQILDETNYATVKEGEYRVGQFAYGTRTLLVSWKKGRADKDAHDRSQAIERTKKKLEKKKNPKEYLGNWGAKKYLAVSAGATIALNEDKINKDRLWDGLHGVVTNAKDLSHQDILNQYGNLWQVEESFRVTKHDLKVRPVFHWKPERVRAHLAICYVAYALVRYLEHRVRLQYAHLSPERIRQILLRVQTSILYDRKKKLRYALPSRMSQEAKKIYQICGIGRSTTPTLLK